MNRQINRTDRQTEQRTSAESHPSGASSRCTGGAGALGGARTAMEAVAVDGPVRQLALGASTLLAAEPAATWGMRGAPPPAAAEVNLETAVEDDDDGVEGIGGAAAAGGAFLAGLLDGTWDQSTSSGTSQSCWPERMRSSSASSSAEGMPRMPPLLAQRRECVIAWCVPRCACGPVCGFMVCGWAVRVRGGDARSRPQTGHSTRSSGRSLMADLKPMQWMSKAP